MPRTSVTRLFEKHVEKVVLGATAVGLTIVMAFWVIPSPREVELTSPAFDLYKRAEPQERQRLRAEATETEQKLFEKSQVDYSPDEVDRGLRNMAEWLGKRLERQDAKADPIPDYPGQWRQRFGRPYPVEQMSATVVWGGSRPKLIPTEEPKLAKAELAALTPLPAPRKPLVAGHLELVEIPKETKEGTTYDEKELVAAHVAAVFDHGKLLKKWREALKETGVRARFVVLAVEARRRQLLPGGRWSAPVPVSMVRVPDQPPFTPLPPFDENAKNHNAVLVAVEGLADIASQEWILEPEYYAVYRNGRPTDWMINKPRTEVSDLEGVELASRRSRDVRTGRPGRPVRPSDRRRVTDYDRIMDEKRGRYERGDWIEEPPRREPGAGVTEPPRREPGSGVTEPPRREPGSGVRQPPRREPGSGVRQPRRRQPGYSVRQPRRREPGYSVRQPPRREPGSGATPAPYQPPRREPGTETRLEPPAEVVEEEKVTSRVPSLADQLSHPQGILEVWFHDTMLAAMETYSYQIRLVLFNPMFGKIRSVQKEQDADQLQLFTPWSEWSDPAKVKSPTEFYLAGAMPPDSVYVTVSTVRWGHLLDKKFTVRRGDPIGAEVEMTLERPSGKREKTKVDFKTGAVAVDFEFNRKIRVPNSTIVNTTTELLYLDAEGTLRCRTLFEDQRKTPRQAALAVGPAVPRP